MTPAPGPVAGPLAGWRVLVPRGGEWGHRVAALLARHGAEPVVVPLIEFAPPDDVGAVDDAVRRLAQGAYTWVVVTSGTTVAALAERAAVLDHAAGAPPMADAAEPAGAPGAVHTRGAADAPAAMTPLTRAVGRTRVAAVGPGTARALGREGVTAHLVPAGERSARGLLAEFPPAPADAPARALVPHSDLAEPTVVDGLRAAGWDVDDVVAYRTVPGPVDDDALRDALASGGVDAVLLSSASTVVNLLDLLGRPAPSTVVACIGPRTQEAARNNGLPVDVVPGRASAEDLVDALVAHAGRAGRAVPGRRRDAPDRTDPPHAPHDATAPATEGTTHPR